VTERRFCDLHTHSTASDGTYSPAEVIDAAERLGLSAVALTDHDTVVGLATATERATAHAALTFIPGIEISARWPDGTLHILGLGIDAASPDLAELADYLRACRNERNPKMLGKLQAQGLEIDMDDVHACLLDRKAAGPDIVSRVHLAEALRRKGYAKDRREAFEKYVGQDGSAYVEKERLAPSKAIAAIVAAGGTAVLAHPVQLRCGNNAQLERAVHDLVDLGLGGIEAYHSDHRPEQTRLYLDLARRFGLAVAGGSDFHGFGKPDVKLGRPRVPVSAVGREQLTTWARR
jgi:predicted metal-dependent phosphoesterase TrpH